MPYNSPTPIYYNNDSKRLFFIIYIEEKEKFYLYVDDILIRDTKELKKLTKNKKFIFFYEKINSFEPKEIEESFIPKEMILHL